MSLPNDARIHYHCAFDLLPLESEHDVWPDVLKVVRSWIKDKARTADGLIGSWFFKGGEWADNSRTVSVSTDRGEGTVERPQHWALRYEEPCGEVAYRRWRTDIGVALVANGSLRVSVKLVHYLLPGFIGDEPESPVPTCPYFVKKLIRSRDWSLKAGTQSLSETALPLRLGDIPSLIECLECPGRECPIIVVSTLRESPECPLIDPDELARKVAGAAVVFLLPTTPEVVSEVQYLMDRNYQCINGMVRVYMPMVRFSSGRDYKRHRFFSQWRIRDRGVDAIVEIIVRGLSRWPGVGRPETVASIEEVDARAREFALARIRAELAAETQQEDVATLREWAMLLEQDNARLNSERSELITTIRGLESRCEEIEGDLDALGDEKRQIEYLKKEAHQRAISAERELEDSCVLAQIMDTIESLPTDLVGVLGFVADLYRSRIVVLDEAIQSAKSWKFDHDKAWCLLRAMARELPVLHFESEKPDIEREFKARTGYKLAMTEGPQTKNDRKLMATRKRLYQGKAVEVTHHVRLGNRPPDMLCTYYFADHERKLIVIGHCGDHLPTAGTRRRGQG